MNNKWTIVLFPKIQIDTAISHFLLKEFGDEKFPGIKTSNVEFWSELPADQTAPQLLKEGYILIDLGLGKFDHHRLGSNNKTTSASLLVAQHLEIENRPDLQKLLEFARRDDLEGQGTASQDPIDRAFGLSGLLTTLNKALVDNPQSILNIVTTLITSHYIEEHKRYELLPKEYEQLKQDDKVREFQARQFGRPIRVIFIESDNSGLAGYIRSKAVGADVVIQKASTGHVNFITKQQKGIQLKQLSKLIKLREAEKNNLTLFIDSKKELERPGRTQGLPHWYYDTRANTLQNGGLNPQGIPATSLTYEELESVTKQGLDVERENFHTSGNKITKGKGVVYID